MRPSKKKREDDNARIAVNIRYYQQVRHVSDERCALACGFSEQTFRRRMASPGNFAVSEIAALACLLNTTSQKIQFGQLEGSTEL